VADPVVTPVVDVPPVAEPVELPVVSVDDPPPSEPMPASFCSRVRRAPQAARSNAKQMLIAAARDFTPASQAPPPPEGLSHGSEPHQW
jgi:hypothetical protein